MKLTYLGHSAFEITTKRDKILIDPFLACYPNYNYNGTTNIFITHGHRDHVGESIKISNETGATITAVFELANYCSSKKAHANPIGLGAWINFSWGKAMFLPAFHSSSSPEGIYMGCPAGILFEIEGKRIFHAGDTCLNSEMKVLGEVYNPDIAILPIGGTFTMDVEQAAIAANWIGSEIIIPMHFNTFDAITADVNKFVKLISEQDKTAQVMSVRETLEI